MVAMVDEVRFVNTPDRGTLVRLTMLLDPTTARNAPGPDARGPDGHSAGNGSAA